MKQITLYIGYVMGILGFAGVVWTYAQKQAEKDYSVKDLEKEVIEIRKDISDIKTNMATAGDFSRLLDTIHYNNRIIKIQIEGISSRTTRFVNQFTKYIAQDSSLTKEDLREIINELNEKKN